MQDYSLAAAHVSALAPNETLDWRFIHDSDKSVPAIPRRGTLDQVWADAVQWNNAGYGVFCAVSALDGQGRELANVNHVRAHTVDLDSLSAPVSLQQAAQWNPAPGWYVCTSPGRFHVYWPVQPYRDNERFKTTQRKLLTMFNGDRNVIDATRVLRVPGFINWKHGSRHLVTCAALGGYGHHYTIEQMEHALQHVQVFDANLGERYQLGDPTQAAPSLEWLTRALTLTDPNALDRDEWLTFSAGFKQAGWNLADPDTLFNLWSEWCGRYDRNDVGENAKLWRSLTDTAVGWSYVLRKAPALVLDGVAKVAPVTATPPAQTVPDAASVVAPPPLDCSGDILTHLEQKEWFKGCFLITSLGRILTPDLRMLDQGKFNAQYGGKQFIIDANGKMSDEAWRAATRSTLWNVPKVDHFRFLPHLPYGATVKDALGRLGVNLFRPVEIESEPGDVSPFLRHMQLMIPDAGDRKILLDYTAHVVKYPGHKIGWAPMVQSCEGVGKGFFQKAVKAAVGEPYCHTPKAPDLVKSGSTFNAWMANKLLITVDEIKVDEKRELIEILKPMITDAMIEVQAKGVDQVMADNLANWMFFTNYKDAIPVSRNSRRYAIFYSAFQTRGDMLRMGLDDDYFDGLFNWLEHQGGRKYVAHYLLNYPIEKGAIPGKAPRTTSTDEAVNLSRGPIERAIADAITDGNAGFRNGWASVQAVHALLSGRGIRQTSDTVIEGILTGMGYAQVGRAVRAFGQECHFTRTMLYNVDSMAPVALFGRDQGYE